MTDKPTEDSIEKWYYDLGALAAAVEHNDRTNLHNSRRNFTIAVFTLFCFIVLGLRTEFNARQITSTRNTQRYESCVGGIAIIKTYNAQLRAQSEVELNAARTHPKDDNTTRFRRSEIYLSGIIPTPDCSRLKP